MCLTIPAQVVKIDGKQAIVRDSGGKEKKINVFLLSGLKKGDWLLYTTDLAIKRFPKRRQRYYRTFGSAASDHSSVAFEQKFKDIIKASKTRDLTKDEIIYLLGAEKKKKKLCFPKLIW